MFKFLVAVAGLVACFSVQAKEYTFSAVEANGSPMTFRIDFGLRFLPWPEDSPFLPEVSTLADGTIVHRFDSDLKPWAIQSYWEVDRMNIDTSFGGASEYDHVVVDSMLRPDNTTALRIRNDYEAYIGHTFAAWTLDVEFSCECSDLYVSELSPDLLDHAHLRAGTAQLNTWTSKSAVFTAVPEPDALALVLAGLVVSGVLWKRTSLVAAPSGSARSAKA
ncbi:MAG: hypothetical protein Q7V20_15095 [Aquabacterium sp.]|uniref:hypothetical protein n=1 Tax=Aquabacterium sp. TaxID=1872578 RepID=UPI00271752A0|nr:hypothetical protein [Aquabacterium sp.]MDO9004772.1 hypothetical protein [Aquabacterium sp.]